MHDQHPTIAVHELLCPECRQGKKQNCCAVTLNPETDEFVPCATTAVSHG